MADSRSPLLHRPDDAPELGDRQARLVGDLGDLGADFLDLRAVLLDVVLPALAGQPADPGRPVGVQLVAVILLEEVGPVDLGRDRHPEEPALEADELAVEVVHLADQVLDAAVVEVNLLHQPDEFGAQRVDPLLRRRRHLVALLDGGQALVLGPVQLGVGLLHRLELLQDLGEQGLFHHREGDGVLVVIVVVIRAGAVRRGMPRRPRR